jgi:hypothetical protein
MTAQLFHFIILKLKLTKILKSEKSESTFLPHAPPVQKKRTDF